MKSEMKIEMEMHILDAVECMAMESLSPDELDLLQASLITLRNRRNGK